MMAKQGGSTTVPKLRFPEFRGANGWQVKPLGSICEVQNNRRRPITSNDRIPGPYPYYGASGVVDSVNDYIFDERLLLVGEDGAKWGRFESTAFIAEGKYWVNNHAHVLKSIDVKDSLLENYLVMLDIAPFVTGAAPPKLTLAKLKSIPIPVPPTSIEQQKIADCLTSLDEVITAQGRKVEALKAHKRGLMQQLFPREGETRPRLRFPEFCNAPEWESVKLASICRVQRGKFSHRPRNDPKFFGGPYAFIQTGDVVRANGGAVVASQSLNELGLSVSKLFKPTIVLITIAANIGDTALLETDACFTDSVVGLIPKVDCVTPRFLESTMRLKKEHLNQVATTGAQKNINNEILEALDVLTPEINEQVQIEGCLASLDTQIATESDQLNILKTHKQGLMQQLFPAPEVGA